jgi:hypothetical protein
VTSERSFSSEVYSVYVCSTPLCGSGVKERMELFFLSIFNTLFAFENVLSRGRKQSKRFIALRCKEHHRSCSHTRRISLLILVGRIKIQRRSEEGREGGRDKKERERAREGGMEEW